MLVLVRAQTGFKSDGLGGATLAPHGVVKLAQQAFRNRAVESFLVPQPEAESTVCLQVRKGWIEGMCGLVGGRRGVVLTEGLEKIASQGVKSRLVGLEPQRVVDTGKSAREFYLVSQRSRLGVEGGGRFFEFLKGD